MRTLDKDIAGGDDLHGQASTALYATLRNVLLRDRRMSEDGKAIVGIASGHCDAYTLPPGGRSKGFSSWSRHASTPPPGLP
ncbi:hypothetical protein CSOJ01_01618 [Colletotrichum sojae]|uniref:Uncharacterized protein n=1 Tax=Colletotrichum sojae TaxID=2175907 RepID=A0A8H6JUA2_9PEZI|nr:hypothetical protein CSOJ01_01618 [Colletotrichum sojae]